VAGDLVTPALIAAWALGRLLGPQLMVAGGGKPTQQWFGMYYADQIGRRLPVPIFQSLECAAAFVIVIALERRLRRSGGPVGVVTAVGIALWSLSRFFDSYLWLGHDAGTVPIEAAGLGLFGAGMLAAGYLILRARRRAQPPERTPQRPAPVAAPR
jgi:hypothetical protein